MQVPAFKPTIISHEHESDFRINEDALKRKGEERLSSLVSEINKGRSFDSISNRKDRFIQTSEDRLSQLIHKACLFKDIPPAPKNVQSTISQYNFKLEDGSIASELAIKTEIAEKADGGLIDRVGIDYIITLEPELINKVLIEFIQSLKIQDRVCILYQEAIALPFTLMNEGNKSNVLKELEQKSLRVGAAHYFMFRKLGIDESFLFGISCAFYLQEALGRSRPLVQIVFSRGNGKQDFLPEKRDDKKYEMLIKNAGIRNYHLCLLYPHIDNPLIGFTQLIGGQYFELCPLHGFGESRYYLSNELHTIELKHLRELNCKEYPLTLFDSNNLSQLKQNHSINQNFTFRSSVAETYVYFLNPDHKKKSEMEAHQCMEYGNSITGQLEKLRIERRGGVQAIQDLEFEGPLMPAIHGYQSILKGIDQRFSSLDEQSFPIGSRKGGMEIIEESKKMIEQFVLKRNMFPVEVFPILTTLIRVYSQLGKFTIRSTVQEIREKLNALWIRPEMLHLLVKQNSLFEVVRVSKKLGIFFPGTRAQAEAALNSGKSLDSLRREEMASTIQKYLNIKDLTEIVMSYIPESNFVIRPCSEWNDSSSSFRDLAVSVISTENKILNYRFQYKKGLWTLNSSSPSLRLLLIKYKCNVEEIDPNNTLL